MVCLKQRQAVSPHRDTLFQIVIGKTLVVSLYENKEKEFGDGNPWTTVHEPRLASNYSKKR